jgi:uncharacterized protein (TIGR03000 family)
MRTLLLIAATGLSLCGLQRSELAAEEPGSRSATILVYLPADAKLTIDGDATSSTSGTRWFVTPPLPTDGNYRYTFQAQYDRAGQTVSVKREVVVRAGRQTTVSLHAAESRTTVSFYPPEQEGEGSLGVSPSNPPAPVRTGQDRPGTLAPAMRLNGNPAPPRAAPFSEQSPLNGSGPPGSNHPSSLGVAQG